MTAKALYRSVGNILLWLDVGVLRCRWESFCWWAERVYMRGDPRAG